MARVTPTLHQDLHPNEVSGNPIMHCVALRARLKQPGYPSEGSLSRSMSGPLGPSILPSSAYGEFRDAEREVARQRRRNIHESRRQSKLLARRTMLPSTPGIRPSEVEYVSGSIDSLAAHSGSSYDGHYVRTPSTSSSHGTYSAAISA